MKTILHSGLACAGLLLAGCMSFDAPQQNRGRIAVHVRGEVKNPGNVSLSSGAIASDAISAAGGFTRLGDARYTTVRRGAGVERRVYVLHPGVAPENRGLAFPLRDGDVVEVLHEVY
jgi:protein involved in polysaccharide export with SLBB domain